MRAIGYVRLSKADRARKGETSADVEARQRHSLQAQRAAITAAAERNGWDLVHIYEDNGATGTNTRRSEFQAALAGLRKGDMLMIARQDRLTRDVADFIDLLRRADRKGWYISILDQQIDTSTAAGWLSSMIQAVFAEYESRVIGERTRSALDIVKATGTTVLGKPSAIPADVQDRIRALHQDGHTANAIATRLTADEVPTQRGGVWRGETVMAFLRREGLVA